MAAKFYDKDALDIMNLNHRLEKIQEDYLEQQAYIRKGIATFNIHEADIRKRVAHLLNNERRRTEIAVFLGPAVITLAVLSIGSTVTKLLKWVGKKMAKDDQDKSTFDKRTHARDWKTD